jgi:hypothetical protein
LKFTAPGVSIAEILDCFMSAALARSSCLGVFDLRRKALIWEGMRTFNLAAIYASLDERRRMSLEIISDLSFMEIYLSSLNFPSDFACHVDSVWGGVYPHLVVTSQQQNSLSSDVPEYSEHPMFATIRFKAQLPDSVLLPGLAF